MKLNFVLGILPIPLPYPNLQDHIIKRIVPSSLVPQYLALTSTSAWAPPVNRHLSCPVRESHSLERSRNSSPLPGTFCSLRSHPTHLLSPSSVSSELSVSPPLGGPQGSYPSPFHSFTPSVACQPHPIRERPAQLFVCISDSLFIVFPV